MIEVDKLTEYAFYAVSVAQNKVVNRFMPTVNLVGHTMTVSFQGNVGPSSSRANEMTRLNAVLAFVQSMNEKLEPHGLVMKHPRFVSVYGDPAISAVLEQVSK